jgi:uncharacterized repeat protein (TIGR01451 family)
LGIIKTDGQDTAVPGSSLTYTIVASNDGPDPVIGAVVADAPPAALMNPTWTCTASAGSSCAASGSGNIDDNVTLLARGSATYLLTGTVDSGATGTLANTATVTPPPGVSDPDPTDNSATDVDVLAAAADLGLVLVDGPDPVLHGAALSYVPIMTNAGPSDATAVTLTDVLPPDVTFVSSIPGPPTCTLTGGTFTCGLGALAAGASTAVTIHVTANASAGSTIVNTATVSANEVDPDPANNSATATTTVAAAEGELTHGTDALLDLAALPGPAVDQDFFRISQKPRSSYEIAVDATSGDIGSITPPLPFPVQLERVAADGQTVLQTSVQIGLGYSRSLRWTTQDTQVDDQFIRVRSGMGSCATNCGPDDVYRIRMYETSYSIPRFNNTTQVTLLFLQNPTDYDLECTIYFYSEFGGVLGVTSAQLSPKEAFALDTRDVVDLVSGSIVITQDGRYGDLIGKAVSIEPGTGFSFDIPLEPRPPLGPLSSTNAPRP